KWGSGSRAGRTAVCAGNWQPSPLPDLVGLLIKDGEILPVYSGDALVEGEVAQTTFRKIIAHHIDGNPFIQQSRQISRQVRRLGLPPLPELQGWLSLLECRIVDTMAAEQEHQVGAGTAHGTGEPENGVVLLLGGGAEGLIDNLQDFHGIYLVPMVRVLKASDAYRHRSGGPPRPQPSMTSLTPRSSTQRPQL